MTIGGGALGTLFLGSAKGNAQTALTDTDYLNFALNLEYLEAEFYTLAIFGRTLSAKGIGTGAGTSTTGGGTITVKPSGYASCMVAFSDVSIHNFFYEVAAEEQRHVTFLRGALGAAAVAEPNIDLYNSFNAAAAAAGIGPAFDPFADEISFLLGSYIFEDVGVTAYHGAAGLLTSATNLGAAAAILAVEAYHAGNIRRLLFKLDQANPDLGIAATTDKISKLRETLDGTGNDDVGLGTSDVNLNTPTPGFQASRIVNADSNSIAFSRTTQQVLNIVYASKTGVKGGFFPSGLNGNIA